MYIPITCKGILIFEVGNIFIGNFKNGIMNGFGDFVWHSGKSYSGFYKNDLKEGLGLFYWQAKSELYYGFWKKGKRDGPAIKITKLAKSFTYWEEDTQILSFNSIKEAYTFCLSKTQKFSRFFKADNEAIIKEMINRKKYQII